MTRKNANKKFRKKSFIIGCLLVAIAILIYGYKIFIDHRFIKNEEAMIDEFFKDEYSVLLNNKTDIKSVSTSYLAILEIDKIGLKTGIVCYDSNDNNVNKHIEILAGSKMPDIDNSVLILAGHSGTSRVSYFQKLNLVNTSDNIFLYYKGQKYTYSVYNKYKVNKNGEISIRGNNTTTMVLTTCDIDSSDKQLVVMAELIDIESYKEGS